MQPYSGPRVTLYTRDGGRTWQHTHDDDAPRVHRVEVVDQATWRAALAAGEVAEGDAVAFVGTHGPEGDGDGDLKEFLEKFGT